MKRKLLMNALNMIILIPLTFSLSGCEDLQKIIPEQIISEENGETDSKNEDLQLKEEELIGRWIIEGRGYPTHIRMHSPTGDNGNNRVCYAIMDDDASGTPMLETEWVSDLTDFTGSDVILYKKAE